MFMEFVNKIKYYCILFFVWIFACQGKTIHSVYHVKEHSEIGFMIGDLRLNEKMFDDSSIDVTKIDFKTLKASEYVLVVEGKLFVKRDIDREKICNKMNQCCCIDLLIFLLRPQGDTDYLEIKIMIDDVNDHAPAWSQASISLQIPEHTKIGTKYRLPIATDQDSSSKYSITKYYLEYSDKRVKHMFSLVYNSDIHERVLQQLWLKVDDDIDREKIERIDLKLIAKDSGKPSLSGHIVLTVNITDVNDNEPFFEKTITEVFIKENNQPNDFLCQIIAKDNDITDINKLRYSFGYSMSSEEISNFHINDRTGKVFAKKTLDYENDPTSFYIPVQVTDGSNVAESTLIVRLINENDNAPLITILPHVNSSNDILMVEENSHSDKTIATITTSDVDNRTTVISCRCPSGGFHLQKIDAQSGSLTKYVLSLTRSLDRESDEWLQVIVICHDDGHPQQTSRKLLKIQVLDRNDCIPQFVGSTTSVSIDENLPKGTFVMAVNASDCDNDINGRLTYKLDYAGAETFVIEPSTGVIQTNVVFDRETTAELRIVVNVFDRNNKPSITEKVLSSSIIIRIIIRDVNDCAPVFKKLFYEFSIPEESSPRMLVGSVSAIDADVDPSNHQITFFIIPKSMENERVYSDDYFVVNPDGRIYTTNRMLDRELYEMFSFTVGAKDGPQSKHRVTVEVVIKIEDVNDNYPQWIHSATSELSVNISQEDPVGRMIIILKATDNDIRENGELHFEITQGNEFGVFRIDHKSGSIYLAKSPPKKGSEIIRLIIKVSDNGKIPLSNTTTLKVRILRDASWLSFEGRHLEKDLVVMICMISVTLIVSGILVVAIILLKCKHCYKPNIEDISNGKDSRPGHPDGRSSPTVSEFDNSPHRISSDMSLYRGHVCGPRGFILEASHGLTGFQALTKPEDLPMYYTLKRRTSMSDPASEEKECNHESHSPQIISFPTASYTFNQDYGTLPSPQDSMAMQFMRHNSCMPHLLSVMTEPNNIYSSSSMMTANVDGSSPFSYQQTDKKTSPSVKWSDMIEDKGVYQSFCHPDVSMTPCVLSKDQITSFV